MVRDFTRDEMNRYLTDAPFRYRCDAARRYLIEAGFSVNQADHASVIALYASDLPEPDPYKTLSPLFKVVYDPNAKWIDPPPEMRIGKKVEPLHVDAGIQQHHIPKSE